MRNKMTIIALMSTGLALPAFALAAGHGGHGAAVSQAAAGARADGMRVGPAVRTVARENSQGPMHASQNAITHVNGDHGRAGANSVLGSGGATVSANAGTQAGSRRAAHTNARAGVDAHASANGQRHAHFGVQTHGGGKHH